MIILASASPRRRELLARICRGFTVEVSDVEEITRYRKPHLAVQEIACRKCCAVADRHPRDIVIAADTVVCLGGKIMGKPTDPDDAKREGNTRYTPAYASRDLTQEPCITRNLPYV